MKGAEVRRLSAHIQSDIKVLALDAMGVIYTEANDGPNLLYPFIVEKGGTNNVQKIIRLWSMASMGKISSAELWRSAGVNPALEDEYLQRYRLMDGLIDFLDTVCSRGMELWVLSNDISEWSRKSRQRFGLERYFKGFVISGEIGVRKPDSTIYIHLLEKSGAQPRDVIFVDDRPRNIAAAEALGIATVLFNPAPEDSQGHTFTTVRTLPELLKVLGNSQ
jgi:HAD superfamily hydrolase (TIGR01509 family)